MTLSSAVISVIVTLYSHNSRIDISIIEEMPNYTQRRGPLVGTEFDFQSTEELSCYVSHTERHLGS
jgi:hypothetical protein